MEFLAVVLTVLLLSPSYAANFDLLDRLQAQQNLNPGLKTRAIGRRLKQEKNKVLITKGRYDGDFFNHDNITISFAAGSGISGITCALIRDPDVITPIDPCTSPVDLSSYLEVDGLYGFAVFGRDRAAGRTVNDTNAFVVDRTPPQTDLFGIEQEGETATFEFKGEDTWDAEDFECRLDTDEWKPCSSPKSYKVGLGDHVFRVRAIDPAGNKDINPAHDEWTVRENLEATALSNEVVVEEGDGGSSKIGIIAVAVFVPLAVVTLVGVLIFLNRKKLGSVMYNKQENLGMERIP